jgi:hypothetical protein
VAILSFQYLTPLEVAKEDAALAEMRNLAQGEDLDLKRL